MSTLKTITIRLDEDALAVIDEEATRQLRDRSSMIRFILAEWLRNKKKNHPQTEVA